jgi:nitrogen fixation/metabolism regulation signal transduction histidine kinase
MVRDPGQRWRLHKGGAPKRLRAVFTTRVKGTGLGLAIINDIVQALGGGIQARLEDANSPPAPGPLGTTSSVLLSLSDRG